MIATVQSPQGALAALDSLDDIQRTRPLSKEEQIVYWLIHAIVETHHLADYQPEEDAP